MTELTDGVNWIAVLAGTVAAFALGMLWYGRMMFQRVWAAGTHNIAPPDRVPMGAMALQVLGTFLMAWLIGITAIGDRLLTAVLVILAIAALMLAGGLMSQKSQAAALVDAGYVVAMGIVMIVAQGVF
jgi:Protein of unknown function (DUF1761)